MENDKELFIIGLKWLQENIHAQDENSEYAIKKLRIISRFKTWMEHDNPKIDEVKPLFKNIYLSISEIFIKILINGLCKKCSGLMVRRINSQLMCVNCDPWMKPVVSNT